ncbi:MAG: F0F1 ATP synthase subunit gamma [Planctomycetaceae bacterium]|nr:F0F1 ATP synthase subunit gamma [Planctomycetaceae bacterium]
MPSLEALKRKIENAEDLQSVVNTMKTLAAVSIRQFETAVESLRDYHQTVECGMRMLLWEMHEPPHVFTEGGRMGAIVFGSDQGMCGQFNEQIAGFTLDHLSQEQEHETPWAFLVIGMRAVSRLQDAGFSIDGEFEVPGSSMGISPVVQDLLEHIEKWQRAKRLHRIDLFYNRRISASAYRPHRQQFLPIDPQRFYRLKQKRWDSRSLPCFTMDQGILFSRLIRQYLFVSLFQAFAESLAGENASRIASMQAASRNIEERLSELRTEYNQLRQTSITEELLDVVTGFEALTHTKKGNVP